MNEDNKILISSTPKVSVLITTYNREAFIRAAIDSVLAQSYTDWEIIVIDDASEDKTESIVSEYTLRDSRIKYYKNEENLGVSKSRNLGLKIAKGKYIAVLDSDDIWIMNDKLERQYSILESKPYIGLIGTFVIKKYPDGKEINFIQNTDNLSIKKNMLMKNQFVHSSVMYRKELAGDGYDISINLAEDFELFLKIGSKSELINLPEYSTKYLVNPNGESIEKKLKMALIVNKLISRHKKQYPNYFKAKTKSYARILLTFFGLL